jgi:hypothetical protein
LTKEDVFYTCNEDEDLSYFIQDYFLIRRKWLPFELEACF